MGKIGLTENQLKLFIYIKAQIHNGGVAPSFDQMMAYMGLRSKSGVHRLVKALEERGHIKRLPHKVRAIHLCEDTPKGNGDSFAASIMRTAEMANIGSISKSEALRSIYEEAKAERTHA